METCQGDPAKEAVALFQRLRLRDGVEVIGLGLKPAERKAVELIAQAGKGKYYGADSTKELADALVAVGPKTPPRARPVMWSSGARRSSRDNSCTTLPGSQPASTKASSR